MNPRRYTSSEHLAEVVPDSEPNIPSAVSLRDVTRIVGLQDQWSDGAGYPDSQEKNVRKKH